MFSKITKHEDYYAIYLIQIVQKNNATGFEKINLPLKQKDC